MLHTMAPFFILSSWSRVTTFLFPEGTERRRWGGVRGGWGGWGGVTCAGDDDVHLTDDLVQLHHSEPVHAEGGRVGGVSPDGLTPPPAPTPPCLGSAPSPGLQAADGVDLGDVDDGSQGLQSRAAAFPHLQRQTPR